MVDKRRASTRAAAHPSKRRQSAAAATKDVAATSEDTPMPDADALAQDEAATGRDKNKLKKKQHEPVELPDKVVEGRPLPTVDEPQQLTTTELLGGQYQSVANSGVLAASLQRSRSKWAAEGVFERYWTKSNKRKSQGSSVDGTATAADSNKRTYSRRVGTCKLIIEPHMFDCNIWIEPEPPSSTSHAHANHAHHQAPNGGQIMHPDGRPQMQYGPPNGAIVTPPPIYSNPKQARPQYAGGPLPQYRPYPQPSPTPQQQCVQQQPQRASPYPPTPSPQPTTHQQQQQQQQHQHQQQRQPSNPPNEPATQPAGSSAPSPAPSTTSATPNPPSKPNAHSAALSAPNTSTSNPPQSSNNPNPPPKSSTPTPGGAAPSSAPASTPKPSAPTPSSSAAKPPADPVIQMLADRASQDPQLKAVMKIVATGNATQEQLEFFQRHINEFTRVIEERKARGELPGGGTQGQQQQQQQQKPLQQAKNSTNGNGHGNGAGGAAARQQHQGRQLAPANANANANATAPPQQQPPQQSPAPSASAPSSGPDATAHHRNTPSSATPTATPSVRPGPPSSTSMSRSPSAGTAATSGSRAVTPSIGGTPVPAVGQAQQQQHQQQGRQHGSSGLMGAQGTGGGRGKNAQHGHHAGAGAGTPQKALSTHNIANVQQRNASSSYGHHHHGPISGDIRALLLEFTTGGDRFLFPKYAVLEFQAGGRVCLASFLIVHRGSSTARTAWPSEAEGVDPEEVAARAAAERKAARARARKKARDKEGGGAEEATPAPGEQAKEKVKRKEKNEEEVSAAGGRYDPALDYYQPVTARFAAEDPACLAPLGRWVAPREEVRRSSGVCVRLSAERIPEMGNG
ncbi:hypothetical protein BDY21DRAFT_366612 [Lineolata rhizophorae]|uniref:SWR1-complex protein 3 domain-containing protein n=1 Tax=Lineolata rhizophorae TaxID=578093 RepID=A0A6A6NQU1_9PEZI|nr:hypothetical protein BDY21DRAFT_366612 [Lineolata rhizophorae]